AASAMRWGTAGARGACAWSRRSSRSARPRRCGGCCCWAPACWASSSGPRGRTSSPSPPSSPRLRATRQLCLECERLVPAQIRQPHLAAGDPHHEHADAPPAPQEALAELERLELVTRDDRGDPLKVALTRDDHPVGHQPALEAVVE